MRENGKTWYRICKMLCEYKKYFPGIICCLLGSSFITFIHPLLIRQITDCGILQKNMKYILLFSVILIIISLTQQELNIIQTKLFSNVHNQFTHSLYKKTYWKINRMKIQYFAERGSAVINLKGGVAKTVTTNSVAYILASQGNKVLIVDNDKQGDASRGLNCRTQDGEGIDRIMTARHPEDWMKKLIRHTEFHNMDVLPANMRLLMANQEVMFDQTRPQQYRIKNALACVADQYDFCIIDNAPDINVSTINALTACDDVLIPVEIDDNTTEGLPELVNQIGYTKEELNPELKNYWIFITKYDKNNLAQAQGTEMIEAAGYPMLKTKIRYSRKVSESTYARKPIPLYSARSLAAKDYECLVKEYLVAAGVMMDKWTEGREA